MPGVALFGCPLTQVGDVFLCSGRTAKSLSRYGIRKRVFLKAKYRPGYAKKNAEGKP